MSASQRASRGFHRLLARPLALAVAATLILGHGLAIGDEVTVSRSLRAFDALCISTRLDKGIFDAQVRLFEHQELPREVLRNMSPDNEAGYAVSVDGERIFVTLGRKKSVDGISRSCTIMVDGLTFAEATKMLESKYSAQELDRFTQGLSQLATYRTTLAGYPTDMGLSVQSGEGLTVISIFETPRQ